MTAPATIDDFLDVVRKSNQIDVDRLTAYLEQRRQTDTLPPDPRKLAALLIRDGLLTNFQAEQFLQGKYRGFHFGGYRILERLGVGGNGAVYLAEHEVMKRRAAIKILPSDLAGDPGVLERFRREAQAAAALDHPNIVRAYDFRQEGNVHFLVMEYVDGPNLEEVMRRNGPLAVAAACDYARQAAVGLQHAHEAGLVHRDVKPANLLVDGIGTVKVLDLGLARFSPNGAESLTKQFDENVVMGTADYLAPEQALNLHDVDHRADVYSLGATLYTLLAGEPPFHAGTVTQKLLWHQMRDPKPIRERRPDVPQELADVVARMMAKTPEERYDSCAEVAEALEPFCDGPVPQGGGPAGARAGDSTASYLKPKQGGSSRRNMAPARSVTPPRPLIRDEPPDEPDEPLSRRTVPDVRKPVDAGGAGLMILGAVMTLIVLAVGGVIAFLIWGPQPQAQVVPDKLDKGGDEKPPAVVAWRLPDGAGMLFELRDGNVGLERLAFAGDGRRVAVACADNRVRVWDLAQKRVIHNLAGHAGAVNAVAFDRSGLRVVSASADGTARLWDLPSNRETKRFETKGKRVWCAAFANNDTQILTCGEDPVIRLWDVNSGNKVRDLPGHTLTVNWVAVRPGRNEALSASWDKTLRLWNLNDGKRIREYQGHAQQVSTCAFTPDGTLALSGSNDGKLRVYETDSGKPVHTFTEAKEQFWTVAVSVENRRVVAGGSGKAIYLYDLKKRQRESLYAGQPGAVTGLAFAPDGRHFVSCGQDGALRVWGLPPLQP
jgi:serine/threonine protein kinase/WD40 repeat protein